MVVFAAALLAACGSSEPGQPPVHGMILVVLDTVRADRLGVYGHTIPTSPALDKLAADGVVFEHALSHASWTLPAAVGLFSGHYPSRRTFRDDRLRVSSVERLLQAGYQTAAFTEGGFFSAHFGFDRGFELYWEKEGAVRMADHDEGEGGVERTFAAASEWLAHNAEEPFFLMVHSYEAHTPYRRRNFAGSPPPGLAATFEQRDIDRLEKGDLIPDKAGIAYVRALYDGGILAVDTQMGQLRQTLRDLGLHDRTVIVVTADHGEDLAERQPQALGQHGHSLHRALTHIPLIVFDPRRRDGERRVSTQVRLIDVMPTFLELAGLEPMAGASGRSLVPLMDGRETTHRLAFGQIYHRQSGELLQTSISDGEYQLIARPQTASRDAIGGGPRAELYRLANDPEQRRNLAGSEGEILVRLVKQLKRHLETMGREGPVTLDAGLPPALKKQLEALGYLE